MLNMMEYSKIDESTVDLQIKSSAIENVNLKFKQKFENSESGNKKFAKCVSAFANTLGGYLFIGLGESNGIAKAKFPILAEEAENEIQRLESLLNFDIEPHQSHFEVFSHGKNDIILRVKLSHCTGIFREIYQQVIHRKSTKSKRIEKNLTSNLKFEKLPLC